MVVRGVDLVSLAVEGADYQVPDRMSYSMKLIPPLGFQYLSATLKASGYECRIYDQPVLRFLPEGLLQSVDRHPGRAIGFYTDSALKPKVLHWIRTLRELGSQKTIIIGGPGSFGATDYLEAGADFVVHGEGERAILDVLNHLNGKQNRSTLRGVTYRENGEAVDTAAQELIEDVDGIPFPDRDEYPIETYHDFHMFPIRIPFASMLTSRGCPHRCTFCAIPAIWGQKVRQRSPENCMAEIDLLTGRYDVKFVGFNDNVFALSRAWLSAFCEGLILRRSPVHFSINVHPFSFRNQRDESVALLARAGCRLMVAGLHSVDPRVLENVNQRPEEPMQLMELVHIIRRHGIAVVVEFLFGLPGDTRQSWDDALQWSFHARPQYALFYSLSKLEGTTIGEEYKDRDVTGFSEEEIRAACAMCQRRFFLSPATILRDLWFVVRRNPRWILYMLKNIRCLIHAVGFKRRTIQSHTI